MDFLGLSGPLMTGVAIAAIGALAFYIAFAAGQFNVSQAGFVSIGAYSVAMTTTSGSRSIWLGLVIGIAISMVLAAGLSALTRKLSGVYLAMATLAFVQLVQQTIYITPALNGSLGIYGIPLSLTWIHCWIILAIVAFFVHRIMNSRIGYEMRILREDPVAARGVGVNEIKVRIFSGVASAAIGALAGTMQALTTSYISPEEFGFGLLIQLMSYAIVGGTDRYWGPILGAVVLVMLPEYTRALYQYRMVFSGLVILGVVVAFPEGVAGGLLRLNQRFRSRFWPSRPLVADGVSDLPQPDASRNPPVADAAPIVSASGVSKQFGGVRAVDDTYLDMQRATVHGLIGPNGAGKSTLVDLLSGEQRSASGAVYLEGVDVTAQPAFRRARMGIVRTFQHSRVTQNITAHEVAYSGCLLADQPPSLGYVFCLPSSRRAYKKASQRAAHILVRLGLADVSDKFVRDLGWEQQRRLEIIRAMSLRPKVLLLDEPTAGMHAGSLPDLSRLIRELAAEGLSVMLIEHNVTFIRLTVDMLYAMDAGKVIANGDPDAVLSEPAVVDSYLGARSK